MCVCRPNVSCASHFWDSVLEWPAQLTPIGFLRMMGNVVHMGVAREIERFLCDTDGVNSRYTSN